MGQITEDKMHSGCPYCGYHLSASGELDPHILAPRTVLEGKYMIGRTLGAGGCGITYLGYDLNLELRIAIKEYYPVGFVSRNTQKGNEVIAEEDDKGIFFADGKKKYIQEARMLARFAGLRNIVSVRDYFEENNTCYIIMEYLDGETLKSYITRRGGRISCDEVMRMLQPLLVSLNEVHRQGMIHRDISPDNIMILKDGTLKLLDFGSARDMARNTERSASVMLKPGYAPEEQYRIYGAQGTWTDVYALCATVYRCLTGRTPVDALSRKEHDTLLPPSQLGVALSPAQEAALLKGMAVDAEQRYKTLGEFYRGFYCNEIPMAQSVQPGGVPLWGMSQQAGSGQSVPQFRTDGTGISQQAGTAQGVPQWGTAGPGISQRAGSGQGAPPWGAAGQGMPQQMGAAGQGIQQQNGQPYPAYQLAGQTSDLLPAGKKKRTGAIAIASVSAIVAVLVIGLAVWAFLGDRRRAEEDAVWSQGEFARGEDENGHNDGQSAGEGVSEDGNHLPQEDGTGTSQNGMQGGLSLPNGLTQNVPGGESSGDGIHGLSQSLGGDQTQQSDGPRLRYEIPEEFVEQTKGFFYAPDDRSSINVLTAEHDTATFQYTEESFCQTVELFYREYYDLQVDVNCTEFTKTTINGYNALIIRLSYDVMGVALEQVQCAVETQKDTVTTITMSQPAGAGWMDAFERVLDSLRVE